MAPVTIKTVRTSETLGTIIRVSAIITEETIFASLTTLTTGTIRTEFTVGIHIHLLSLTNSAIAASRRRIQYWNPSSSLGHPASISS